MGDRPLLLLDVDGVLNPYAASRRWLDSSDYRKRNTTVANGHTYPVWLNRAHGPLLLSLAESSGLELVWCTTWEHEANTAIGPRLGLPELPVIEFTRKFDGTMVDRWKFGPVLEYAAGRPLAWLDDDFELQHEDCGWFREQRGDQPTLLQLVDPHHGLRDRDVEAVARWAAALDQAAARPVGDTVGEGNSMTEPPFVVDRPSIYRITWSGYPLGTPESVVGEWTGTLTTEEARFVAGSQQASDGD